MRLHLADTSQDVVLALRQWFSAHDEVEVHHGDILQLARCAVVSPANSEGFMDGGLDAGLSRFFGREKKERSDVRRNARTCAVRIRRKVPDAQRVS